MSARLAAILALLAAPLGPTEALAGDPTPASESPVSSTSNSTRVHGLLRRAGDRAPLAGVALFAYPAPAGARPGELHDPEPPAAEPPWVRRIETDDAGAFALDELPAGGLLALEVVTPGHLRTRWIIDPAKIPARGLRLYLRPEASSPYRTTVVERRQKPTIAGPAPVERQLSREEIRTLPGSQGDPLRALQSLPGVARSPFGAGLLVLRGASPRQSLVYVGDHPVPIAFHLSGLASVLPPGAIDTMTFAPSNFAPAFGNASGGMVAITPRAGRRDAYHGEGYLDLGGVGGQAEGPVGKGSFLVAARRAHLDLPLRVVGLVNPWSVSIVPTYYDYQAFYDRPLGRGRSLHVGFIGAGDRLAFKESPKSERDPLSSRKSLFEPRISFHRVDLAYRAKLGDTAVLLTPALRVDTNRVVVETNPDFEPAPRRSLVSTLRAQLDHALTETLTLTLGADAELGRQTGEVRDEPESSFGQVVNGAAGTSNTTSMDHVYLGLYGEAVLRRRGLMLAAGTRFSALTAEGTNGFAVDPRLRVRQELGERWILSGGVGLYAQPWVGVTGVSGGALSNNYFYGTRLVLPDQIVNNYDPTLERYEGNIRMAQALHATAGAALHLAEDVEIEAHGFFRELYDPHRPQRGTDNPSERAFGGEFIVRKRLTRRLYGWVAYTLLWAQQAYRTSDGGTIYDTGLFDQQHNLVAVLSARLPRDWQVGGRFRVSSGLPYTPVVGAVGGSPAGYLPADEFEPIFGFPLSARFPLFQQLDLRVDKRWIRKRTIVTAYLDVLNVLNHQNTEAYVYNIDYSRPVQRIGLPILPLLGVRVEI
ncbi:MAG: Plug domain-containing protein [Myxococcales bacterium]|nr:Plug domain-containing protein [Myxococcales bacterium]